MKKIPLKNTLKIPLKIQESTFLNKRVVQMTKPHPHPPLLLLLSQLDHDFQFPFIQILFSLYF